VKDLEVMAKDNMSTGLFTYTENLSKIFDGDIPPITGWNLMLATVISINSC